MVNKKTEAKIRDSRIYYIYGKYSTKRVAKGHAKKLRNKGRLARVEPAYGRYWYVLATPAKTKKGLSTRRGKKKHRPRPIEETFFEL
jgi:hypothetical protein